MSAEEVDEINKSACAKCLKNLSLADSPAQRLPIGERPFWVCEKCMIAIREETIGTAAWTRDQGWNHFLEWRPAVDIDIPQRENADSKSQSPTQRDRRQ